MSHAIGVIYPLDEEERMQRQTHTARIFPIDKGGVVVVVWGGQKQKPTIGGHEREDSNHFAHKPLPLFFLTLHDELPWLFLGCTPNHFICALFSSSSCLFTWVKNQRRFTF
jgi:hypothetical protein